MNEPDLPSLRLPSQERRELVVQKLTDAFAAGRLDMDDFEARVELAWKVQTLGELDAVLKGLESRPPEVSPAITPAPPFRADRPKASTFTVAILSGTTRRGRWVPAPVHRLFALMGGATLDFRDAELGAGVTEVRLNVLMGGAVVVVPPDMDVEVDGFAVMGGIEQRDIHPAPLEDQPRRLRIIAHVIMGGVEVKVKARKQSANADQLEERRERKKRLRGG